MKIAVLGAKGRIGSRIVAEALRRGHEVTAVVRDAQSYTPMDDRIKIAAADIFDSQDVQTAAFNQDAVISAYSNTQGSQPDAIREVATPIINGLRQAQVKRLLVVGGAGSLEAEPGLQLVDTPSFPEAYKPVSLAHREAFKAYQQAEDLEWTFVSPSAEIFPGERTGKYRIGGKQLLIGEDGKSRISMEDFAAGILDEIENPQHIRQQMTVGY